MLLVLFGNVCLFEYNLASAWSAILFNFQFNYRLVEVKLLHQVGQEGMLQLVRCRVGIPSVFLEMVRFVIQSLRFVTFQSLQM
jgi:hypothetical protein